MKTLSISEIQTSDIIFYDQNIKHQCKSFCEKHRVDHLPSYDGKYKYTLTLDKNSLTKSEIEPDHFIEGQEDIFAGSTIDRFRSHPIMFVRSHGRLTGMVHFSDYNANVVSSFLYGQLGEYEKSIRNYLLKEGYKAEDLIEDLENKSKHEYSRSRLDYYLPLLSKEIDDLNIFSLRDLIFFANDHCRAELNVDVANLRNQVMHYTEFVGKQVTDSDTFIFDFPSFEKFTKHVEHLFEDTLKIKNNLFFSDNRF